MFEAKEALELATHDDSGRSSAQILVATEGCGVIEVPGMEPVTLAKGDAVVDSGRRLIDFGVRPQWALEFLQGICSRKTLARAGNANVVHG